MPMARYYRWITVCMPKQVCLLQTWNAESAMAQVWDTQVRSRGITSRERRPNRTVQSSEPGRFAVGAGLQLAQAPHLIVKSIFPNAAWRLNRRALKAASLARPLTPSPRQIRSLVDRSSERSNPVLDNLRHRESDRSRERCGRSSKYLTGEVSFPFRPASLVPAFSSGSLS